MADDADQKKHILVVNDDPAILDLFEEILTDEGYTVTLDNFRRSTSDLMDAVREIHPDLVVMDFVVGGELKGWQLLQATQMDRSVRDIPVIICTAAVKQVTELGGHLQSLGVHVVIKPFDIDDLLDVITKVWETHESDGTLVPGPETNELTVSDLENTV